MKVDAKLFRKQFIYLFLLLGLAVSFNSCDDDDDDVNSFLEMYANSTWQDSEGELFLRIVNNPAILVEGWEYYEECYEYWTIGEDGTLEILENSENKLIVEITYNEDGFEISFTFTLTVNGNNLTIVFESDDIEDSETILLISSDADVDDFEECQ